MLAITGAQVITNRTSIEDGVVLVEAGSIVGVGATADLPIPDRAEVVDAAGLTVGPGLIDLHTHGADGVEANDATPEAILRLQRFYARHGVTGFLAGIWGYPAVIDAAIDAVVAACDAPDLSAGAALLGIYLEGPFLNPERKGAFPPATLVPPDRAILEHYIEKAQGHLRLLTLAPELAGADDLIELALAQNVVCAAGHTAANWEQMEQAYGRGVRHSTHTYNAMNPLHHRDPGVLGFA
ncbi:MAG: N-acetylglucosamine-6-phosphate deacetylase, partial [uncultured Chloroflexia bacterium]